MGWGVCVRWIFQNLASYIYWYGCRFDYSDLWFSSLPTWRFLICLLQQTVQNKLFSALMREGWERRQARLASVLVVVARWVQKSIFNFYYYSWEFLFCWWLLVNRQAFLAKKKKLNHDMNSDLFSKKEQLDLSIGLVWKQSSTFLELLAVLWWFPFDCDTDKFNLQAQDHTLNPSRKKVEVYTVLNL